MDTVSGIVGHLFDDDAKSQFDERCREPALPLFSVGSALCPQDLKTCAPRAFERSINLNHGEWRRPVHPEQLATMERAMLSLPRMTREVFFFHGLDGSSYAKIARAAGLTTDLLSCTWRKRCVGTRIWFHRSILRSIPRASR